MRKGQKHKIQVCICDLCGRQFNYLHLLAWHKAVKHEGKRYPQLWEKGKCSSPTTTFKKGFHYAPDTEFKKGNFGDKSRSWKGGRVKSKGGYTLLARPGHPRITHGNYVYEHIIIWEEANKMPLPEGYVVHHLNGIKDDNRPKNLLAVPKRGHSPSLTVKEIQKRLREVEAELAQHRLL